MSTITKHKFSDFDKALRLLDAELSRIGAPSYRLVICGGSALIAANLVHRTTKDSVQSFLMQFGYETVSKRL